MPLRRLLLPLLLTVALPAGCAPVPAVSPAIRPLAAENLGLAPGASTPVAEHWWSAMGDPQLDRIITDALATSPSLAEAQARVRRAEASIEANKARLLPKVGFDVDEQYQRLSEKYIIPPPFGGSTVWIGTAQANLTWSLDLAGRQAALVDQTRAGAAAARLDADAAKVTLAGAIAQAYINLVRADQQVAIASEFRISREEALRLAQSRVRNQLASRFDERAAETLLAEARQAQIRAEGDYALMVHALAALAGHGAEYYATISRPALRLDHALTVPETVPIDLLGRRADLLAALARIEGAKAGRRVARADFYPNIDLKALLGVQAIGLGSLFTGSALTYGAGPAIHLPIFEGGRLAAGYRAATAELDVAIAQYNGAVLSAVREATDALSAIHTADADATEQRRILASLSQTIQLDQTRFRVGLGSRLDTLTSNDRLLQARQTQVNIDADAVVRRIQLAVALGGGFDPIENRNLATLDAGASQ